MSEYTGIDYGLGRTNIDHTTGIRYGVIHADQVDWWAESSEAEYAGPNCPRCGNSANTLESFGNTFLGADGHTLQDGELPDEYTSEPYECTEYVCVDCQHFFGSESAFSDEAVAWSVDTDGLQASQSGDDCDIFVVKSPYYTRGVYCSPCAPGAVSLGTNGSIKAYCFGHDWFETGAPYRVFRVSDDTEVFPTA